jgi:hypothetical protein
VREKADRLLNDVLDAATLGTYDAGAGSEIPADEAGAPKATRAGNGSRSRAKSTAASEAGV